MANRTGRSFAVIVADQSSHHALCIDDHASSGFCGRSNPLYGVASAIT
jgi:hypothetical protein